MIYLSQATQANCMKAQTEYYRRNRDKPPNTMGALYWQLNDIWQGQSWSSISYDSRWKMLHYSAKRFFNPILLSSYIDKTTGEYMVSVVNDYQKPVTGTITATLYAYAEQNQHRSFINNVQVPSLGSLSYSMGPVSTLLGTYQPKEVYVSLKFVDQDKVTLSQNEFYFTHFSMVDLPLTTVIATDFQKNNDFTVQFTITSTYVAPYVWLETSYTGNFDDNGFLLLPEEKRKVLFYSDTSVDVNIFPSTLTSLTVVNTYEPSPF